MYQSTIVIGNVGGDPELRYTTGGVAVCSFSVAVNRVWYDRQTKEKREKTTWFRVSAWRGLAETANEYIRKGMLVMISGEVKASAFIGKDGQPHATLELTAQEIRFLSRPNGNAPSEEMAAALGGAVTDDLPF